MDRPVTRDDLIKGLQEDLSREYQAIIAYVVYSQALKGAEYMSIAKELEVHAGEELAHAITIAKQIDYLGGMPNATALPVKLTEDAETMLRADLENENDTVAPIASASASATPRRVRDLGRDSRNPDPGTGTPDRSRHRARRGRARCLEDEAIARFELGEPRYAYCAKMRSHGTTAANR